MGRRLFEVHKKVAMTDLARCAIELTQEQIGISDKRIKERLAKGDAEGVALTVHHRNILRSFVKALEEGYQLEVMLEWLKEMKSKPFDLRNKQLVVVDLD